MYINEFVVEITRNCNLQCSHCLRGSKRKDKLDINKLRSFLRQVERIGTLTTGGGEPSLALDTLWDVHKAILDINVSVDNLYIVTNGIYKTLDLAEWFLTMTNDAVNDNETSAFTFSFDIWHNEQMYSRKDYRMMHFYDVEELFSLYRSRELVRKHSSEKWNNSSLIKMGRAKWKGFRELTPDIISVEENGFIDNVIYLTCNGEIYSSCDLSYREMTPKSKFYIGKYNEDLIENIKKYNERIKNVSNSCV